MPQYVTAGLVRSGCILVQMSCCPMGMASNFPSSINFTSGRVERPRNLYSYTYKIGTVVLVMLCYSFLISRMHNHFAITAKSIICRLKRQVYKMHLQTRPLPNESYFTQTTCLKNDAVIPPFPFVWGILTIWSIQETRVACLLSG